MNICFTYLFCFLLYNIFFGLLHGIHAEKIMQVSFCVVHSVFMLADIVRSSRRKYRLYLMSE